MSALRAESRTLSRVALSSTENEIDCTGGGAPGARHAQPRGVVVGVVPTPQGNSPDAQAAAPWTDSDVRGNTRSSPLARAYASANTAGSSSPISAWNIAP